MSDLSGSEIIRVVNCMVGATEPYGDSYIDIERLNNQHKLEELAECVIAELCRNAKYTSRCEYSMREIAEKARNFLGYLVEEYGLMDYVKNAETNDAIPISWLTAQSENPSNSDELRNAIDHIVYKLWAERKEE